jgi:hypothetical protein
MVAPGEHPEGEAQGAKAVKADEDPITMEATPAEATRLLKQSEHFFAYSLIGVTAQTPQASIWYIPVTEEWALEPLVGIPTLHM